MIQNLQTNTITLDAFFKDKPDNYKFLIVVFILKTCYALKYHHTLDI